MQKRWAGQTKKVMVCLQAPPHKGAHLKSARPLTTHGRVGQSDVQLIRVGTKIRASNHHSAINQWGKEFRLAK